MQHIISGSQKIVSRLLISGIYKKIKADFHSSAHLKEDFSGKILSFLLALSAATIHQQVPED